MIRSLNMYGRCRWNTSWYVMRREVVRLLRRRGERQEVRMVGVMGVGVERMARNGSMQRHR